MRTLTLLSMMSFLAWAASAGDTLADPAAPMLSSDNRIRVLVYDEADVYTITTRYGYQTNVVFAEGEQIETVSVGDRSMWQIIPSGRRMFIRPMVENVTTNMTVLTNRRSYQFDLKSVGGDQAGGNIYVARFVYPEDMPEIRRDAFVEPPQMPPAPVAAAPMPAMPVTLGPSIAVKPASLNHNYTYTGSDKEAPTEVYDDGASTFIKYRNLPSPLPGLYVENAGGERQVTYGTRDGMLVMDEVVEKFSLKGKNSTITVYNEMPNPKK